MQGQLIENVAFQQVIKSGASSSASTLYNGSSISVDENGIDTFGMRDVCVLVNVGTIASSGVLNISVYASEENDPATAELITGKNTMGESQDAIFTQITPANDESIKMCSIFTQNQKRYLWVKTTQNAISCSFGVSVAMFSNNIPVGQTVDFNITQ